MKNNYIENIIQKTLFGAFFLIIDFCSQKIDRKKNLSIIDSYNISLTTVYLLFNNPTMSIVDRQEEFNHKPSLFSVVQKDFFSIPVAIRTISISTFLFVLGWGLGADTFFSIYLKTIVSNVFRISVIAALIPLIKMFFAVTIGTLDDHTNIRSVVFLSK
jgi:hypothetical protein